MRAAVGCELLRVVTIKNMRNYVGRGAFGATRAVVDATCCAGRHAYFFRLVRLTLPLHELIAGKNADSFLLDSVQVNPISIDI